MALLYRNNATITALVKTQNLVTQRIWQTDPWVVTRPDPTKVVHPVIRWLWPGSISVIYRPSLMCFSYLVYSLVPVTWLYSAEVILVYITAPPHTMTTQIEETFPTRLAEAGLYLSGGWGYTVDWWDFTPGWNGWSLSWSLLMGVNCIWQTQTAMFVTVTTYFFAQYRNWDSSDNWPLL